MKRKIMFIAVVVSALCLLSSGKKGKKTISDAVVSSVAEQLVKTHGEQNRFRVEKGVKQMAALWNEKDGTSADFEAFCIENFIGDAKEREQIFERLCKQFETIYGGFNKMVVSLMEPVHVVDYESFDIDEMFGAWSPSAHFEDDFFANKIAFYVMLNFPFYSLEEKNNLSETENWSALEWGYARMGDMFISRIPAEISQKMAEMEMMTENYIANYNIFMGKLVDDNQKTLFPEDMKLITHWGLRDELKSQYAAEDGLVKQRTIYEVMKRIIDQTIPQEVINKNDYTWNPYKNEVYENGKKASHTPEPDMRYEQLLLTFKAMKAADAYTPMYPTYISRKFDQQFELSQPEV